MDRQILHSRNHSPVCPTKAVDQRHILLSLIICSVLLFWTSMAIASDSYQELNSRFVGYSEEEIGPAYFDVHYSGKWKQSHQMMGRYSLFRSAELALELGFPAFSIESLALLDEPDVQIYETCSDIRVISNSAVPAATLLVQYLPELPLKGSGVFSTQELMGMKELLLDEDKEFNLGNFLQSHGVPLLDERNQ